MTSKLGISSPSLPTSDVLKLQEINVLPQAASLPLGFEFGEPGLAMLPRTGKLPASGPLAQTD